MEIFYAISCETLLGHVDTNGRIGFHKIPPRIGVFFIELLANLSAANLLSIHRANTYQGRSL